MERIRIYATGRKNPCFSTGHKNEWNQILQNRERLLSRSKLWHRFRLIQSDCNFLEQLRYSLDSFSFLIFKSGTPGWTLFDFVQPVLRRIWCLSRSLRSKYLAWPAMLVASCLCFMSNCGILQEGEDSNTSGSNFKSKHKTKQNKGSQVDGVSLFSPFTSGVLGSKLAPCIGWIGF